MDVINFIPLLNFKQMTRDAHNLKKSVTVNLEQARYDALFSEARRYAWWMGHRSTLLRKSVELSGWRLSQIAFKLLGRPHGALSWPLGLAFLMLNSSETQVRFELNWIERCLSGIFDQQKLSPARPHIDRAPVAYAAMRLDEIRQENGLYLQLATSMAESFAQSDGASDGTIPYTPGSSLVLVDTLGFLCPFLARFARITGQREYAYLAVRQIDAFLQNATDPGTGWICHAFDRHARSNLGLIGWGRGVGWLLLGLTDTLLELDDDAEKQRLAAITNLWFEKLAGIQRPDGHWPWHLTVASETADSSLTSLVAYSLSRLMRTLPDLFNQHQIMLNRSRAAIDQVTTSAGQVTQASGEAGGIGTYSEHFGSYLWALGPAVATDKILLE